MAYVKQTWQTGDVVTSSKLNHMEDGIAAGGVTVVPLEFVNNAFQTSVTWQELKDLVYGGTPVVLFYEFDFAGDGYYQAMFYWITEVMVSDGTYSISAANVTEGEGGTAFFVAENASSKATLQQSH